MEMRVKGGEGGLEEAAPLRAWAGRQDWRSWGPPVSLCARPRGLSKHFVWALEAWANSSGQLLQARTHMGSRSWAKSHFSPPRIRVSPIKNRKGKEGSICHFYCGHQAQSEGKVCSLLQVGSPHRPCFSGFQLANWGNNSLLECSFVVLEESGG